MTNLFVKEKLIDPYIIAIDGTLLRVKGHLWHKSSMIKGLVPRSGIDTDATLSNKITYSSNCYCSLCI
jgi:hypothetical protein